MVNSAKMDFGYEMSRIMPLFLREVVRKHEAVGLEKELPHTCIAIMDLLDECGPCRMSMIASSLNMSMGAITGFVDKLIKRGLVTRKHSSGDRRVVMVALLEKGKMSVRQFRNLRKKITNDLYSVLSDQEKKMYIRLLKKVHKNIKERK